MSISTLLGKMILMIMLSDDMSSLSHDEFMEVICGVCARKGAYSRKRDGKRSDKQKLKNLKPIRLRILELTTPTTTRTMSWALCVLVLDDAEKAGSEAQWKLPVPASSRCRGGPRLRTAARAAGAGWAS